VPIKSQFVKNLTLSVQFNSVTSLCTRLKTNPRPKLSTLAKRMVHSFRSSYNAQICNFTNQTAKLAINHGDVDAALITRRSVSILSSSSAFYFSSGGDFVTRAKLPSSSSSLVQ